MAPESLTKQVAFNGLLLKVEERLNQIEARVKTNGDILESEVGTIVELMKEIQDLVKKGKGKRKNDSRETQ
jgi:hypothetical protein